MLSALLTTTGWILSTVPADVYGAIPSRPYDYVMISQPPRKWLNWDHERAWPGMWPLQLKGADHLYATYKRWESWFMNDARQLDAAIGPRYWHDLANLTQILDRSGQNHCLTLQINNPVYGAYFFWGKDIMTDFIYWSTKIHRSLLHS